ncbi:hypothetical protein ACPCSG_23825 [Streptomyces cellulosae]
MTGHLALLNLLGQDVTVTHPDAGHRVWRGRLRDVMHAPCLVLDLPDGRTEVLPQAFTVTPDTTVRTGPDTDAATSGPARAPVVGTAVTSADTVRTRHPDTPPAPADVPERIPCADERCIDERCQDAARAAHDRADPVQALREDLAAAVAAYEALRARLAIAGGYLRQQRTTGVLHGGQTRRTILTRLAAWTEDPGPLDLPTGARRQ